MPDSNLTLEETRTLEPLQERLGARFADLLLLRQALVHRSYLNENPGTPLRSNERLEFLGDAVLGFIVAHHLYHQFPDLSEGDLTALRASLVRTETLARIARRLELGSYLYLGHGEEASGGRQRKLTLARTVEAIIGAVVEDQGLDRAREFTLGLLDPELRAIGEGKVVKDFKSLFQEFAQRVWQLTPVYRTVSALGPDHEKRFLVEVLLGDRIVGRGSGPNKQSSEQASARQALEYLGGLPPPEPPQPVPADGGAEGEPQPRPEEPQARPELEA